MSTPAPAESMAIDRPTLVGMLQQASILEHSLCCEYLYAAFTLKSGGEEGVTPTQAELSEQWGQQITKIAIQEMYHLMLASNLLTAIGETPYFDRPNFPMAATRFSDIDLPSLLTHFDFGTAKRFMCWEKPDVDGWWIEDCAKCAEEARAEHNVASMQAPDYSSIGALYGLIDAALAAHPEWIDPSTATRQVTSDVIPFSPAVTPITTYADAKRYIDIIVTEGEGGADWESQSHFAYFHQIVVQIKAIKGSEGMAWPTVANPVYDPANDVPGAHLVDDPNARPIGLAFNQLYLVFMRVLARLFIPDDKESAAERRALANTATAMMPLVIKPLAVLLTRLPAGKAYPGRFAGPSFELPAGIVLPAGPRTEAIAELKQDLSDVKVLLQVLSFKLTTLPAAVQAELATIAARLETLLGMMDPAPAQVAS